MRPPCGGFVDIPRLLDCHRFLRRRSPYRSLAKAADGTAPTVGAQPRTDGRCGEGFPSSVLAVTLRGGRPWVGGGKRGRRGRNLRRARPRRGGRRRRPGSGG